VRFTSTPPRRRRRRVRRLGDRRTPRRQVRGSHDRQAASQSPAEHERRCGAGGTADSRGRGSRRHPKVAAPVELAEDRRSRGVALDLDRLAFPQQLGAAQITGCCWSPRSTPSSFAGWALTAAPTVEHLPLGADPTAIRSWRSVVSWERRNVGLKTAVRRLCSRLSRLRACGHGGVPSATAHVDALCTPDRQRVERNSVGAQRA